MRRKDLEERLFSLKSKTDFEALTWDIFVFQYEHLPLYQVFCDALKRPPRKVKSMEEIPFLPIQFFKSHKILPPGLEVEAVFKSSGTTGTQASHHYVHSLKIYEKSFIQGFEAVYGKVEDYVILALLPSYLERKGSSLIYMAQAFIDRSRFSESGFYLNNYEVLTQTLKALDTKGHKILLLGVSFALLDLVEREHFHLKNTLVMETGGMKGRRKEMTRQELHARLVEGFGVPQIHSEYGMTELLSQAYSQGNGTFSPAPTMDILIREPEDPLHILSDAKNGGINVIDLANLYSCSFIATQDLGKKQVHNHFEILGRFDHSDIRGCNLMVL